MTQPRLRCSLSFIRIITNTLTLVTKSLQGIPNFGPQLPKGMTQPRPNWSLYFTTSSLVSVLHQNYYHCINQSHEKNYKGLPLLGRSCPLDCHNHIIIGLRPSPKLSSMHKPRSQKNSRLLTPFGPQLSLGITQPCPNFYPVSAQIITNALTRANFCFQGITPFEPYLPLGLTQ